MRSGEIRSKDLFPYHFLDLFVKRVLPVTALSYLISVLVVAFVDGGIDGFVREITDGGGIYIYSTVIAAWVSVPPLIWMCLIGSRDFEDYAVVSYWASAGCMALFQLFYLLLFPEDWGRMRLGTLISIFLHVLIFLFLIFPMRPIIRKIVKTVALLVFAYGLFTL